MPRIKRPPKPRPKRAAPKRPKMVLAKCARTRNLTDEVLTNGNAAPGMEAKNLEKYGFVSPVDHFLYSEILATDVSKAWGVPWQRMSVWVASLKLRERRDARLASIQYERMYTPEELVDIRTRWTAERLNESDSIRAAVMEAIASRTEDTISPTTGKKSTKRLSAASIKSLADAWRAATEVKSIALGQPTKVTAQFSHSQVDRREVREHVIQPPAGGAAGETFDIESEINLLALPDGLDDVEAGELVDPGVND